MKEHTIHADAYELALISQGDTVTAIGLRAVEEHATTTLVFEVEDAETVGKLLVAHADVANGHEPRKWD
jgi:hypothetical protein